MKEDCLLAIEVRFKFKYLSYIILHINEQLRKCLTDMSTSYYDAGNVLLKIPSFHLSWHFCQLSKMMIGRKARKSYAILPCKSSRNLREFQHKQYECILYALLKVNSLFMYGVHVQKYIHQEYLTYYIHTTSTRLKNKQTKHNKYQMILGATQVSRRLIARHCGESATMWIRTLSHLFMMITIIFSWSWWIC